MLYPYEPDYTVHPGLYLLEYQECYTLSTKEFAKLLNISEDSLQSILHWQAPITLEIAKSLEKVTNRPYTFWLRSQKSFDDFMKKHPSFNPKKVFSPSIFS